MGETSMNGMKLIYLYSISINIGENCIDDVNGYFEDSLYLFQSKYNIDNYFSKSLYYQTIRHHLPIQK